MLLNNLNTICLNENTIRKKKQRNVESFNYCLLCVLVTRLSVNGRMVSIGYQEHLLLILKCMNYNCDSMQWDKVTSDFKNYHINYVENAVSFHTFHSFLDNLKNLTTTKNGVHFLFRNSKNYVLKTKFIDMACSHVNNELFSFLIMSLSFEFKIKNWTKTKKNV